jgi:hypothetical protein
MRSDATPQLHRRGGQFFFPATTPGGADNGGHRVQFMLAVFAAGQVRPVIGAAGILTERDEGYDLWVNVRHRQPPAWSAAAASCGECGS